MSISVQGSVPIDRDEKALTDVVKSIVSSSGLKYKLHKISAIPNKSSAHLTYSGKTPQKIGSKYLGNNYTIDSVELIINEGKPFKFKPLTGSEYTRKMLTTPGYFTKEYTFEVPLSDLNENGSYRIKMSLRQNLIQRLYLYTYIYSHCMKKFVFTGLTNWRSLYACFNSGYFSQNYNPMVSIDVQNGDLIKQFIADEKAKWASRVSSIEKKFLPWRDDWDSICVSDYHGNYIAECKQRHEVFVSAFVDTSKKYIFTESFYDNSSNISMVLDKHIIDLYKAFDSLQCESGIVNKLQEAKGASSYSNTIFAKELCQYGRHSFLANKVKNYPDDLKPFDDNDESKKAEEYVFTPYGSCNKYICEFYINNRETYSVLRKLVESQNWRNIKNLIEKALSGGSSEYYIPFKDTSYEELKRYLEHLHAHKAEEEYSVVKKDLFKVIDPTNTSDSAYTLTRSSAGSNTIELTNNSIKKFYWNSYQSHYIWDDPRFNDSRYYFYGKKGPYLKEIVENIKKESNDGEIISLHPDYALFLECTSKVPTEFHKYWCEPKTVGFVEKIRKPLEAYDGENQVDYKLKSPRVLGRDYWNCRFYQDDNHSKKSLSERLMRSKFSSRRVACFTIEAHTDKNLDIKKILRNITKNREIKVEREHPNTVHTHLSHDEKFHYGVDCDPSNDGSIKYIDTSQECSFDKNDTRLMKCKTGDTVELTFESIGEKICPDMKDGGMATFYLGLKKGDNLSFKDVFKDDDTIKVYSELPPLGNLRNTLKDRTAMFSGSTIERVEIDTTSTTSMSRMFEGAKKIDKGNFKYWDTSKVAKKADIECMFKRADEFAFDSFWSAAREAEFESNGITEQDLTCTKQ